MLRPLATLALALGTAACAQGADGSEASHGAYEESLTGNNHSSGADDDPGPTTAVSVGDDAGSAGGDEDPAMPPDLGTCVDDGDCELPPGACFQSGTCEGGMCSFEPSFAGDPCDDEDPCTGADVCDGAGNCVGEPSPCEAPHASGGTCQGGLCSGLVCDGGWGNCNGDWVDGCEVALDSAEHCGTCDTPCEAGEHASASCNAGVCEQACDAPWANCDDDWSNGCEIPEGVPNQCDSSGLNPDGCWTPYCGQSAADGATNFGTWFCVECSTCHVPGPGQCQWCNHATGTWYPAETCPCGAYEDLACGV